MKINQNYFREEADADQRNQDTQVHEMLHYCWTELFGVV
jgi:hypothetical protein